MTFAIALAITTTAPTCATCGAAASCAGCYEDMVDMEYSCDACCGHGCEDGLCYRVEVEHNAEEGRAWHRWSCSCGKHGVWLDRFEIATRNGRMHLAWHLENYHRIES